MIEVELKFHLTPQEKENLLKDTTFIGQEKFTDIYYDTAEYALSTNDIWLRSRNNHFLLKLPLPTNIPVLKEQSNTFKKEISDELEIRNKLSIIPQQSLTDDLAAVGILPLYQFSKTRNKYTKEGFIIDIDTAYFDDFTYEIAEIELIVNSEQEAPAGIARIQQFAQQHELSIKPVRGQLIEYIYRKNPEHFNKLKYR